MKAQEILVFWQGVVKTIRASKCLLLVFKMLPLAVATTMTICNQQTDQTQLFGMWKAELQQRVAVYVSGSSKFKH